MAGSTGRPARCISTLLAQGAECASCSKEGRNSFAEAWRHIQGRLLSTRIGSESSEHLAARRAHQEVLRGLRVRWAEEHRKERELKVQRFQEKQDSIQSSKREREQRRQEWKQKQAAVAAQDAKEYQAIQEARLRTAADWRREVASIYAQLQMDRKEHLLSASKNWIRPEDLDKRIEEALDHPVKMFM